MRWYKWVVRGRNHHLVGKFWLKVTMSGSSSPFNDNQLPSDVVQDFLARGTQSYRDEETRIITEQVEIKINSSPSVEPLDQEQDRDIPPAWDNIHNENVLPSLQREQTLRPCPLEPSPWLRVRRNRDTLQAIPEENEMEDREIISGVEPLDGRRQQSFARGWLTEVKMVIPCVDNTFLVVGKWRGWNNKIHCVCWTESRLKYEISPRVWHLIEDALTSPPGFYCNFEE